MCSFCQSVTLNLSGKEGMEREGAGGGGERGKKKLKDESLKCPGSAWRLEEEEVRRRRGRRKRKKRGECRNKRRIGRGKLAPA